MRAVPFTWSHAEKLAPKLRPADLAEIYAAGHQSALNCLAVGMRVGKCWAVLDAADEPVGVFGYSRTGVVWSFWQDLTYAQAREVLSHTREYVVQMLRESSLPSLYNVVMRSHKTARRWLSASGCFDMRDDGERYISFHTKPELVACAIPLVG